MSQPTPQPHHFAADGVNPDRVPHKITATGARMPVVGLGTFGTVDVDDPVIVQIAQRLDVHPAVVCLKWALQRGEVVIPFSTTRSHYLANLRAAVTEPLTDDEMAAIAGIDKNCRLIKGQVFLWKDGQSWEDLWDIDGEITPA